MSELDDALERVRDDLDAVGPYAVGVDTSTDALRTILAELDRRGAIETAARAVLERMADEHDPGYPLERDGWIDLSDLRRACDLPRND